MFKDAKSEIFLAIHVDDGMLIGKDIMKNEEITQLNEAFEMTIIENLEVHVGMPLDIRQGLFIQQENFANKTLDRKSVV